MKKNALPHLLRLPRMVSEKDGIWIIDEHGVTVFANGRMADILRTSVAEMMRQSSFRYVFPEDESAAQRLFNAKSRGDSHPFRFRLRRKDGTPVWVHVQGTPMIGADGEFNGIVGTFHVAPPEAGESVTAVHPGASEREPR